MEFNIIDKYQISVFGGGKRIGLSQDQRGLFATIVLTLEGTKRKGRLYFYDDLESLPDTDKFLPNTYIGYYLAEHFPKIVDILRNEKPVQIGFHSQFNMVSIYTGEKKISEQEFYF